MGSQIFRMFGIENSGKQEFKNRKIHSCFNI